MTATAAEHYDKHLGPIYTWMIGDIDAALVRSDTEIDGLNLSSKGRRTAVDLGAGFGLHALPLASRGFSVVAIDAYEPLLGELRKRAGALPISAVNANLLEFRAHIAHPADVIVCMGDTLTHLPDLSGVERLLKEVAKSLAEGGIFMATFRDYTSAPLQGDARFILVRSDERRVLTCFLEYAQATVTVHDLLHEKQGESWQLRVSSYPKLRLSPDWVVEQLKTQGLSAHRAPGLGGMVRIVAKKSGAPAPSDSQSAP